MHVKAVSSLTPKSHNLSQLPQKIYKKGILPLACSAAILSGVEANAQNNNKGDVEQDTLKVEKVKHNIPATHTEKQKTFNLSERFNTSITGECDYMFGVGSPMSFAIGANSMIQHDKSGSFINLFTGAILSSPSESGQKISPVGIFVGEGFIPNTPLSIRGRIIDKYDGKNTFVLDMPTPRVTIPVTQDKKSTIMLQPMARHLHTQGAEPCNMYGGMINSSFPLPFYLTPTKGKEKSVGNAYTEVLVLYDPKINEFSISGFVAIPF